MPKYQVTARFDALQWFEVTADTPEQAAEMARRRAGVLLCHECAHEVEIGEYLGCQVLDDGGEVAFEEGDE